jgi:serine/threonine protein kinase
MLFPLANGDLYHQLRTTSPPNLTREVEGNLLENIHGVCDAIRYLHDSGELPSRSGEQRMKRIGFHHDLKPANILLFHEPGGRDFWKIGDFGSGAVKFVRLDSEEEMYNRKASTGDPIYSAPEYVVEGRVSRPKDIWSLGGIFLEVLVWTMAGSTDGVEAFEAARNEFSRDSPDDAPTYWCQNANGQPSRNPAVDRVLERMEVRCNETGYFVPVLRAIRQMLSVSPQERPTAAHLCEELRSMGAGC